MAEKHLLTIPLPDSNEELQVVHVTMIGTEIELRFLQPGASWINKTVRLNDVQARVLSEALR